MYSGTIAILCADERSNYHALPGLDIYTRSRDAYTFSGRIPVIAHPPCQQWSRLKAFARENRSEKELAAFCFEQVNKNGGILEHPHGSSFFKYIGADRKKMFSVDQSWYGFPARKRTILYCSGVQLLPSMLSFDIPPKKVHQMSYSMRSRSTTEFCEWLINSIRQSIVIMQTGWKTVINQQQTGSK